MTVTAARRFRSRAAATLLAAAAFALAGCAGRPDPQAAAQNHAAAAQPPVDYVIGPGDQLGIVVYDNPQLSTADVPVRPDGRISIPLVPEVVAAGQTPAALSATLTERLAKYVKDPNVTVMVHGFGGPFDRQIRVIGEATDPQAITYRDHITVLDVMIAVKGLTRFAAGNRAVIIRTAADGSQARLNVRLSDLIKDGDVAQNLEMRPGDTLIIPQSWF